MRVAGYVRVSTQEQAKEGYSIGAQTERLKAYCKARDWTLYDIYTDPAYSGAKLERPALQKLISDVKNHKIDLVLVYKLDRLSRSQKDTLYLIEDVFMKNEVAFVSLNENFDTSTAFGRAMVGILSVFAQLEREQIRERMQMGRDERAKSGLWKGGGVVPIGYEYDETTNQLKVNEYEAMQVREAFDMYVNLGYAMNRIQQEFFERGYTYKCGSWKFRDRVKNVLSNPIYTGVIQWHGETYAGQHTPIISQEIFQKAQQRLAGASWKKGSLPDFSPFAATQLLTGILFCKHCGARYFGSGGYRGSHKLPNSEKTYIHIYTCYSRAKTRKDMVLDPSCKNKRWRAEQLDTRIISEIQKLYMDDGYFDSLVVAVPAVEDKADALHARIAEIDMQVSKILDLYLLKNMPTELLETKLGALTQEKSSLEKALGPAAPERPALTVEQAGLIIQNALEVLNQGTLEERRKLVHSLIKRIDIDNDDLYITWRFQ